MTENNMQPKCAVILGNTLSTIGLRQILEEVMPILQVDTFSTMSQLLAKNPEQYVHFFASQEIVVSNMAFFNQHRMKTIVLTTQNDPSTWLNGFHNICAGNMQQLHQSFITGCNSPAI